MTSHGTHDDLDPGYIERLLASVDESPAAPVAVAGQQRAVLGLFDGVRATDVGNAERLLRAARGRIRYVPAWRKWIVYQGGRWEIDGDESRVTEIAKSVPKQLFAEAITQPSAQRSEALSWAAKSERSSALAAMVKLTRGMPGVTTDYRLLDASPYLLNVENGTVDLRTGVLRPHDPDDLLTMQAPVMFDEAAAAPTWAACVERWQPDPEMRRFLQRALGTALTGVAVENLFVNIGHGGNGKSKFYGAVGSVLGPFCVQIHKSLLMADRHEGHPTHVASLFRARMVVAPETSQGERLAEEQVKNLTGGDTLRARRLYEDEWSFEPTHTAFMHTNYPPRIRGTDDGIWRRVRVIPWDVTIPHDERNPHLAELLAAERSGILNWLIAGVLDWNALGGLAEPDVVLDATQRYRSGEDHLGKFLTECCDISRENSFVYKSDLREAYEQWCRDTGEPEWSVTALGRALNLRFDSTRVGPEKRHVWLAVALLHRSSEPVAPDPPEPEPPPPAELFQ